MNIHEMFRKAIESEEKFCSVLAIELVKKYAPHLINDQTEFAQSEEGETYSIGRFCLDTDETFVGVITDPHTLQTTTSRHRLDCYVVDVFIKGVFSDSGKVFKKITKVGSPGFFLANDPSNAVRIVA